VLSRMTEVLFVEVLRSWIKSLGPGEGGWLGGALGDRHIGRAPLLTFTRLAPLQMKRRRVAMRRCFDPEDGSDAAESDRPRAPVVQRARLRSRHSRDRGARAGDRTVRAAARIERLWNTRDRGSRWLPDSLGILEALLSTPRVVAEPLQSGSERHRRGSSKFARCQRCERDVAHRLSSIGLEPRAAPESPDQVLPAGCSSCDFTLARERLALGLR
jgi:hypothetical protein